MIVDSIRKNDSMANKKYMVDNILRIYPKLHMEINKLHSFMVINRPPKCMQLFTKEVMFIAY